ncbi:NUDIX domain-containing protein [Candidatus Pacearchaeota archaeon]|nr:NUDIX domain-containing protein [Candidatus Pacearchaeota archaeon]
MIDNGLETKFGTFTFLRVGENTLMLHRNKDPSDFLYGKFVPPGGKIEPGESPEACALREFKEETSLDLAAPLIPRGRVFFDNIKRKFQGKPAKFNVKELD